MDLHFSLFLFSFPFLFPREYILKGSGLGMLRLHGTKGQAPSFSVLILRFAKAQSKLTFLHGSLYTNSC